MKNAGFRIGLCTGGGDCPGLNAAIRAVVRHASGTYGMEVVGIRSGLTGLLQARGGTMPLDLDRVADIHEQGGTILGTNNKGSPFRDKAQAKALIQEIIAAAAKLKLNALLVIGGDGTQSMAKQLVNAGMQIVGVPKTIDNDLDGTDFTIGFSTAVDIASDAAQRLRSSAEAHNRLMILEVMGRDAGHIALATALASGADAALLPEIPFSMDLIVERLKKQQKRGRSAYLIIAAEGAHAKGQEPSFIDNNSGGKLLGGIGSIVAHELHKRCGVDGRVAVLGHVQRGGPANATDRILATMLGAKAVDLIAAKKYGRIVGVRDGKVIDYSYRSLADDRRLLDPKGVLVASAEAVGITLGR